MAYLLYEQECAGPPHMKSNALPKGFPVDQQDWDKLIADAPGEDRPPTAAETSAWSQDVVCHGGGVEAFVVQRRGRGPQKAPRKQSITIRFDADVLAALKATGPGWQTRVNHIMREWLKTQPPA